MRASQCRSVVQAAVLITLLAPIAKAQESRDPRRAGPRKLLAASQEIALARSAAPASVSDSASVYVFTDSGYVLAERGSNGAACYVSRSWPTSVEPHCFDSEGASTILPMLMREVELLHRGLTPADAEREVGAGINSGRFRLPRRPAVSYMMSAGQELISDEGRPAGRWRPHVMIYYPFLEADEGGGRARPPDMKAATITGAGTASSSIVLVMPEFVPVRQPAVAPRN
jgi:hypothetical protein